jgi:ParB family chromosome partitioning protein
MGKGLAAILGVPSEETEVPGAADGPALVEIPVDAISPNPDQPRKRFDEESLSALAGSLSAHGILQPVLLRPLPGGRFEIVAGERRWRAAQLAGMTTVPAVVADRDDGQSLEAALIENMAREDLNPVEQARAVAALVEELGLTREQVGKRVGRSRVAVSNLLRLLDLPPEALALLERGELTEGHGKALLLAADHVARRDLARAAAAERWSVRVTEERARETNGGPAKTARARTQAHPDQLAAAESIATALEESFGAEVKVRTSGSGFKVELVFASVGEALDLARRVARP